MKPAQADAPAAARPLHYLRVSLTVFVCLLAWTWLLRHARLDELGAQAARLPAWAWFVAGAALLAGHALRAVRLQRDWRHVAQVRWWDCLRLVLTHNAMVLMLPLRAGEAAYLVAVRREWGVGWGAAGLALLRWRLQDAAVLGMLAVLLLIPLPAWQRGVVAVLAAAALHLLLPPLWRRFAARAGAAGRGLADVDHPWRGLSASVGNWTLKVLASGGLLAALAGLPLPSACRAALGGELAGVQPLQPPAGLGVYEGGAWLAAGAPPDAVVTIVSAALAAHAFSLAVALGAAALAQCAPAGSALREESPS
ncbi:MAG TPA: hypothetical protein VFM98_22075 [Ramlibacter sp.]|uniref:hypothetical protein n=1 Tax=Ramlibacter sp. TaxID=1917967 RepID=UPI002D7F03EB|nr:hypothetical protein [Ramlibacter sp.]HET8748299.1 hypothetical protein [Ramlibacter sp.]